MKTTLDDYVLETKAIGQGSYGSVYRGQKKASGEIVAVKVLVNSRIASNPKLVTNLEKEIQVMKLMKHSNIVTLYDSFTTPEKTFLVMEYCSEDFARFLKRKRTFKEDAARWYLQQIAAALECMRKHNLIHRDLKPSNILVVDPTANDVRIKVADFGYARFVSDQNLAETACGTPLYMAPEVFKMAKYDGKADIWSVGCILYEMLFGMPPFTGATQVMLFDNIMKNDVIFPKSVQISQECKGLISKLLVKTPDNRMSAEEFFMHPFLEFETFERENPFHSEEETQTINNLVENLLRDIEPLPIGQTTMGNLFGDQTEDFIVLNRAVILANSLGDQEKALMKVPLEELNPHEPVLQGFVSDEPPPGIGIETDEPVTPSYLSSLFASLSSLFPFWITRQEKKDLDTFVSFSPFKPSEAEEGIWEKIISSVRWVFVTKQVADEKTVGGEPLAAMLFLLKSMSLTRIAIGKASDLWKKGEAESPTSLSEDGRGKALKFLEELFADSLNKVKELLVELSTTKYATLLSSPQFYADQSWAIYQQARAFEREAEAEEQKGNFLEAEKFTTKALLMYEILASTELREALILNHDDRQLLEKCLSATKEKIKILREHSKQDQS